MNRPTMLINDVRYAERKVTTPAKGKNGECGVCALGKDSVGCDMAITGKAQRAFGGDCNARDVVYVRLPA